MTTLKHLTALLLALTLLILPTLAAAEDVVSPEEIIGLWATEDDDGMTLQILPGIYAPLPGRRSPRALPSSAR